MGAQENEGLPPLSSLLPAERIETDFHADDWKSAVKEAGRLLFETEVVKEEYIQAMVDTAEELGPYIVIAKGIALPHAAPEKGALQTGLSLVSLEPAVNFGNPHNDPVRLVIGLSALDHEMHINALRTLAEIFMDNEKREMLMNATDKGSIMDVIKEMEK